MFIGILALLGAVVLSVVSAIFSINGIQTIFSGAIMWATVMAASMEFAKIAATVWIYRFWNNVKIALKSYIIIAIVILIVISSIGIYGFLAKAYVGQSTEATQLTNKINRINLSIETEQRNIERSNKQIRILDDAIEKYIELDVVTRGLQSLEDQQETRARLLTEIRESETRIGEMENEVYLLQNQIDTLEVNVGPIKYIAILLYGEDDAESRYDDAARLFIILLVVVFDPFAVLLMVAGNISITKWQEKRKKDLKKNSEEEQKKKKQKFTEMLRNAKLEGIKEEREKHIKKEVPTQKVTSLIQPKKERTIVKREKKNPVLTRKEEIGEKPLRDYDPLDDNNPLNT